MGSAPLTVSRRSHRKIAQAPGSPGSALLPAPAWRLSDSRIIARQQFSLIRLLQLTRPIRDRYLLLRFEAGKRLLITHRFCPALRPTRMEWWAVVLGHRQRARVLA